MTNFKKYCILAASVLLLTTLTNHAFAQKVYEAEGTIIKIESPFDRITLLVDEDETEYVITKETDISKGFKIEELKAGQKIKISYFLEDGEYVIKEINMKDSKVDENVKFTGLFDYLDNDIAYVDGKKVKLLPDGTIECPGKKLFKKNCGCEKPKPYRGIGDVTIRKGSYFSVEGKLDKDGIIQAKKIAVCKNEVTKDELELRESIEQSYSGNGLISVKAPPGFSGVSKLSQGNIQIGPMQYKLYDDLKVQGYINMVGMRLVPEYAQDSQFLENNQIAWRFYVIHSSIPNAFAYPNGMVFIHTGLLKIMDNESQLALVLGHEITHVLYEHSAQRYAKSKNFSGGISTSVFNWVKQKAGIKEKADTSNAINSSLNGFVNKLAPQNLSGLFEKTKETQADRVGLLYMYMLGYDLREAPKFWLKMKTLTGDAGFQQKINSTAKGLLQSQDLKLDKNLLTNLGGKGLDAAGGALLESIYASHPQATKRYDDINELIVTFYKDVDFSKAMVGAEEFKMYTGAIR